MLVAFQGTTAPEWVLRELDNGLGGVTLFGFNVADPGQLSALTARLRAAGEPVISLDEEGGDVTRLAYHVGSPYPGNAALGAVDDVELTRSVYRSIGDDLARCGINLDMAPDADVNTADDNPVIGTRSFGSDAALVARHTVAAVQGLQSAGVAACVKHFPGHGATRQDSHLEIPLVDASMELLRERELVPFRAAIEAGTMSVMTAHVRVPALTGDLPATLSPAALTTLLRGELGYDGVVISDALDMRAITDAYGLAGGAVLSLAAGTDLLCLGPVPSEDDVRAIIAGIVAAVRDGSLPLSRLEEAAEHVSRLRAWFGEPRQVANGENVIGLTAARRAVSLTGSAAPLVNPLVVEIDTLPPSRWATCRGASPRGSPGRRSSGSSPRPPTFPASWRAPSAVPGHRRQGRAPLREQPDGRVGAAGRPPRRHRGGDGPADLAPGGRRVPGHLRRRPGERPGRGRAPRRLTPAAPHRDAPDSRRLRPPTRPPPARPSADASIPDASGPRRPPRRLGPWGSQIIT
nr:hypothetical protein GCM10020093_104140 [Planobispora longispora]